MDGYADGKPIYQRNLGCRDNNTSMGSGYETSGYDGWSRSPHGKEFDLPEDNKEKKYKFVLKDDEQEELNFQKERPVGSPDPSFPSNGGHRNVKKKRL